MDITNLLVHGDFPAGEIRGHLHFGENIHQKLSPNHFAFAVRVFGQAFTVALAPNFRAMRFTSLIAAGVMRKTGRFGGRRPHHCRSGIDQILDFGGKTRGHGPPRGSTSRR